MRAHAKLTRSLRITGVRADGYHLIDAEMVSLDLHDVLTITRDGSGITATGSFASGVPLDQTNLVSRALDLLGTGTAHIAIDKQIPHGGGLGGGSTDAATVMRWAGMSSGPAELARASRLGADIPFCLVGGRARVRGIGEIVEPLPYIERTFTLVIPPLTVSTPAAYRAWDDLGGPTGESENDLEAAALVVQPELAWWRDELAEATGLQPVLAGSGSSWFVPGAHPGPGRTVVRTSC